MEKTELRTDVDRLRTYTGPRWDADRVHLVQSARDRTPDGRQVVTYESLDEWVPLYQE